MERHLHDRYGSQEGAAAYRTKYRKSLLRRLSNHRELDIVDQALRRADTEGRALDCPCGAGRITPVVLRHAEHVTAVDLSAAMVEQARHALRDEEAAGRVDFGVASVDKLPFEDGAFDTVVCHRLIHHVDDAEERSAMLGELARVSSRRLVLSFNDATTFKARWQSKRKRKRRRISFTPEQLAREAAPHGLVMVDRVRRLGGLFSLVAVALFAVDAGTTEAP